MDNLVIKNLVQIREQCTVQDNSFGTEGRGTGFVVSTYMTGNRSTPAAIIIIIGAFVTGNRNIH